MTPQEKAESLIEKFYSAHGPNLTFKASKQCAIICVEQIMEMALPPGARNGKERGIEIYWQEVLEHIKKSS